jgi:hypothetical protein
VQHEQFLITVLVVDGRRVSRVRVEAVPAIEEDNPVAEPSSGTAQ